MKLDEKISIPNQLMVVLNELGEVESEVTEALEHYITTKLIDHIRKARKKVNEFQQAFGLDYDTFNEKIQSDEDFYQEMSRKNPLWEQDWIEWKYYNEEKIKWIKVLENTWKRS